MSTSKTEQVEAMKDEYKSLIKDIITLERQLEELPQPDEETIDTLEAIAIKLQTVRAIEETNERLGSLLNLKLPNAKEFLINYDTQWSKLRELWGENPNLSNGLRRMIEIFGPCKRERGEGGDNGDDGEEAGNQEGGGSLKETFQGLSEPEKLTELNELLDDARKDRQKLQDTVEVKEKFWRLINQMVTQEREHGKLQGLNKCISEWEEGFAALKGSVTRMATYIPEFLQSNLEPSEATSGPKETDKESDASSSDVVIPKRRRIK
ncbi:hypothetical protein DM02DRAFT_666117 [Periconia macrospinosa]|uniref:Uncharacterized protein n=1 Tax=Periconia macrospinosa TaxID=97972 RepID=A0A2V1EDE5_9PLEO|nr:hypothetical protein DM02DRAFT_666117 [Periconia macrospinosa]